MGSVEDKRKSSHVLKGKDLRKSLITERNDRLWMRHIRVERTCVVLHRTYYWLQMRDDIATNVKTCLV